MVIFMSFIQSEHTNVMLGSIQSAFSYKKQVNWCIGHIQESIKPTFNLLKATKSEPNPMLLHPESSKWA